jgi:hypothetical protein
MRCHSTKYFLLHAWRRKKGREEEEKKKDKINTKK